MTSSSPARPAAPFYRLATRTWPYLLLTLVIALHVYWSWRTVAPFRGYSADGPFQLYNALRRIDAGQLPGRDFHAFHGVAVPLAHYPAYRLLGGDLFASELARHLVSRLATVAAYLLISWLIVRDLRLGVLWSAFAALAPPIWWVPLAEIGDPGNSMLGLRSLLPLLFVACLYRAGPGRAWTAALAALLALAWLLGVEQGLALAAAAGLTALALALPRRGRPRVAGGPRLGLALLAAVAGLALALLAWCTPAGLPRVLHYYFVAIPADQGWYFGVPPNTFLGDGSASSWRQGAGLAAAAVGLGALWLWAVAAARSAAAPEALRARLAVAVGAAYAAASLASHLGMLGMGYHHVALRVLFVLLTAQAYQSRAVAGASRAVAGSSGGRAAVVGLTVLGVLLSAWYLANAWAQVGPARLSPAWDDLATKFPKAVTETCPNPKTGDVWSVYAGLLEDRLGIFQPHEDYIIHALGDEREAYVAAFAELRPLFVHTMLRGKFPYEEWLQTTTWPFYELVLLNYEVVGQSGDSLLWKRTDRPWRDVDEDSGSWEAVAAAGLRLDFPVPAGPGYGELDLAVVRVEYEVSAPLRPVPLVGQMPRYLASTDGSRSRHAASLPPRKTALEFPVVPEPGKRFTLRFRVAGWAPGADLRVKSVSVRYLTLPPANAPFLGK